MLLFFASFRFLIIIPIAMPTAIKTINAIIIPTIIPVLFLVVFPLLTSLLFAYWAVQIPSTTSSFSSQEVTQASPLLDRIFLQIQPPFSGVNPLLHSHFPPFGFWFFSQLSTQVSPETERNPVHSQRF